MPHTPDVIRNLVLLGHGNSGKTALVDALAYTTKISPRHGDSADGTSISDTEHEEKDRHQTLTSHLFSVNIDGHELNIIDTPGHADFMVDAINAMQVAETALVFVSAVGDVSFHCRRLWGKAGEAALGRAIVVSHPDGENADFERVLGSLSEVFGDTVVPMTYPDADGTDFSSVHSVLAGEGPKAAEYREQLEERVAEADDDITEAYLEAGSLTDEQLSKYFSAALVKGKIVPLFTVCSPKEIGLKELCGAVQKYFPSPVDFGSRNAGEPDSDSYPDLVEPAADQPFLGRVFKVVADPYVGRMAYLRCLRGTLKPDEGFVNIRTGKKEKVGALLGLKGVELDDVSQVSVGDIFVVAKLESLNLDDSVCAEGVALAVPPTKVPPTTYSLAVTPKSRGDEQKINQGLEKLATEDPSFQIRRSELTGELLISGMSQLHLEIFLARLLRRYGVQTEQRMPAIPYQETILGKADGHHRHKKQSGGRGQFAEVYLRVMPRAQGEGFEFVDSVVGGSIPRQFIPEVEKGVRKFLAKGGLAGCPVVDVAAEVYDGKFHDVDSDQLSFQLAGERAFSAGFEKAKPVLLEPIMDVEIHVPERFTGDVAGNLSSSRGRMQGMEIRDGIQVIKAQAPLKEMQDYSTQLRSITAGEGTFAMNFSGYEQVPANLQQEIMSAHKKSKEESK